MSRPSTPHSEHVSPSVTPVIGGLWERLTALDGLVEAVVAPLRVLCFWLAIGLPFLHVPLLFRGLSSAAETGAFVGLLTLNFLALYVGRSHGS